MKKVLVILCLLMVGHWVTAQKTSGGISKEATKKISTTPIATLKKATFSVIERNLSKTTPSGYKIVKFRLINSKDGKFHFLVQEISSPKGKFNRFIPLAQKGTDLYLDPIRSGYFYDCWLMACSTCEEGISQTGMVFCECSVGGCENADTSDPVRDILEKVFM